MSIVFLGDSHLRECHDVAEKADSTANFGYKNLNIMWHFDQDQVKHIEKCFKEGAAKKELPEAIFVLCGGYDLMLTTNVVDTVNKLKGFVNYLNGLNVKIIFVCSILDRRGSTQQEEDIANKAVRNANKTLAKAFKNMTKVSFINIRPPGKLKDIIDDDKYHLKPEGYNHVYKRFLITLEERVIPQIPNAVPSDPQPVKAGKSTVGIETNSSQFKKEPGFEKRMSEFKDILMQDYKRICLNEVDLKKKFSKIQGQLATVEKEKLEIVQVYKKLFGVDLTQESND